MLAAITLSVILSWQITACMQHSHFGNATLPIDAPHPLRRMFQSILSSSALQCNTPLSSSHTLPMHVPCCCGSPQLHAVAFDAVRFHGLLTAEDASPNDCTAGFISRPNQSTPQWHTTLYSFLSIPSFAGSRRQTKVSNVVKRGLRADLDALMQLTWQHQQVKNTLRLIGA